MSHFLQHLLTAALLCILKCKGIAFLFTFYFAGCAQGFYAASPPPIGHSDHSGDTESPRIWGWGRSVSRRRGRGALRTLSPLQPQLYSRCPSAGVGGGGWGGQLGDVGWEIAASAASFLRTVGLFLTPCFYGTGEERRGESYRCFESACGQRDAETLRVLASNCLESRESRKQELERHGWWAGPGAARAALSGARRG